MSILATPKAIELATDEFIQMCSEVYVDFEFVAPDVAVEMLKGNTNNYRSESESTTVRYAKDLEAGLWTYTTATIAFTRSGVLVDGQHRLSAIVRSGVGAWMFVMRNLPEEFADDPNQDKGKMRSASVYMTKCGYKNSINMAASIRCIYRLATSKNTTRTGATSLTDSQVLKCAEFMPQLFFDAVDSVCASAGVKKTYTPATTSAFFYLALRHDAESARSFFDIYARKMDASSNHPANVLREQVGGNRKLIDNDRFLALAFNAFLCSLKNETRKLIRANGHIEIPAGAKKALAEFLEILNG
jgi:hypothetical protein